MAKALAAGGSQAHEPEDHGFMYQHGFYDLDGHGWGWKYLNQRPNTNGFSSLWVTGLSKPNA
jgi:predicted lactoylglutathione lyase